MLANTHVILVEDSEDQGGEFCRISMREELLVDLDESLWTDKENIEYFQKLCLKNYFFGLVFVHKVNPCRFVRNKKNIKMYVIVMNSAQTEASKNNVLISIHRKWKYISKYVGIQILI